MKSKKSLISKKRGIINSINHNFGKIVIFIEPIVDKNENKYYYNIFLEKGS